MKERKLTRVTFDFEDGTAVYLDGEDAILWDRKVNGAIQLQSVHSGNPDPCGLKELHEKQKPCEPYEELEAEFKRLKEIHIHGCECGTDDVCEFARQRDEARAEVKRLTGLLKRIPGVLMIDGRPALYARKIGLPTISPDVKEKP